LLGAVLAGADVLLPAKFAAILLGTALFGGSQASERAFRLLRRLTVRREPAPPPPGNNLPVMRPPCLLWYG
jgi:hypothetical protein